MERPHREHRRAFLDSGLRLSMVGLDKECIGTHIQRQEDEPRCLEQLAFGVGGAVMHSANHFERFESHAIGCAGG